MIRLALLFLVALASAPVLGGRYSSEERANDSSAESLSVEDSADQLSSSVEDDDSSEEKPNEVHPNEGIPEGVAGAQVFRVFIKNKADKKKFEKLNRNNSLDTLHTTSSDVDVLVRQSIREDMQKRLEDYGLEYKILIDDIQRKIDVENPAMSEEEKELVGRQGFDPFHPTRHHNCRETNDEEKWVACDCLVITRVMNCDNDKQL